jgi:hypothetical protein
VAETIWTTREVTMYLSNPAVIDDALFGLSHRSSGQFVALDAKTGSVLWVGRPRQATNTAVVKAASLLFLLNDDGELLVAKSSRTGLEPLKRYVVADSGDISTDILECRGRVLVIRRQGRLPESGADLGHGSSRLLGRPRDPSSRAVALRRTGPRVSVVGCR